MYDLIIIGSGAGGGTLAYALAKTGKKILLLERGGFLPREKENWDAQAVFDDNRYKTKEVWYTEGGKPIHPGNHYFVGGNTKMYGAALLRLTERDFEEIEHKGGISPAWPLKYRDFQPYYLAAERLYQVRGERGRDPCAGFESAPYPFPAVPNEPRIQKIFDGFEKIGHRPFPMPLGIHWREDDRINSACIRCDTCDGFPCLVHAKSDAEVMCVRPALEHPNVTLLTHAHALRLLTDPSGKQITGVEVEREGKIELYQAGTYVVSCGAINSAALLLRSKNAAHPNGLANRSDLVGRNYMCHINTAMLAICRESNTSHYEKTFGLNDFYFGSPEWNYPMGHIQLLGNPKKAMLREGAPGWTPDLILEKMADHAVGWWICSEDLPDLNNRVTLNAKGEIVLRHQTRCDEGHRRLVEKLKEMLKKMDDTWLPSSLFLAMRIPIEGVAHQVGTCRFGTDPKTSVLDLHCKAHEIDNLYVVDGSFFPSCGALNPALTIIANALRVADHLK
ncbi:MAG: GMC family oxidoreductase [Verrucomicrobia bacterium]|nr:GMC family oxidoreductase [Verrucomicrobiota bacterium]